MKTGKVILIDPVPIATNQYYTLTPANVSLCESTYLSLPTIGIITSEGISVSRQSISTPTKCLGKTTYITHVQQSMENNEATK
jgi:hypothetical protein